MNYKQFVIENIPEAEKAVNKWLDMQEDGGTRVPVIVRTEVVNGSPEPYSGLPLLQQRQYVVMMIFYNLEYRSEE